MSLKPRPRPQNAYIEETWKGTNLEFRNCFILNNQETYDQEMAHFVRRRNTY